MYTPSCEFVIRVDRKGNLKKCGCASESEYRVEGAIGETTMFLCTKHVNDLQQKNVNWKFYRVEKEPIYEQGYGHVNEAAGNRSSRYDGGYRGIQKQHRQFNQNSELQTG